MKELKEMLRMHDYRGDRWGVVMSAFFDLCAIGYEITDLPSEWGFKVGLAGNFIEDDNIFNLYGIELDEKKTIEYGNFLNRLISILERAGLSY